MSRRVLRLIGLGRRTETQAMADNKERPEQRLPVVADTSGPITYSQLYVVARGLRSLSALADGHAQVLVDLADACKTLHKLEHSHALDSSVMRDTMQGMFADLHAELIRLKGSSSRLPKQGADDDAAQAGAFTSSKAETMNVRRNTNRGTAARN